MKKSSLFLALSTLTTAAFMVGFIVVGYLIWLVSANLPDAQSIQSVQLKIPLRVYSADGLLISEFGDERRKPVTIDETPQTLIDAILASEDDNFYSHKGIDVMGLVRAALTNFKSGATRQGASTITMQVARNFFLSREKTYIRKLNEVLLAIKLEQLLSKDQILSLYLNKIFLGHRAYGFGAAADVYYGRELNQLSLAETAMLAGLPKAPSSNNPLRSPDRAKNRRNYVLGRLLDLNKINQDDYEQAYIAPVTAVKHSRNSQLFAPHIAEMVRAELIKQFGEGAYWQGLNIHTTILSDQQQAAERSLRKGLQAYDRRHGFRGAIAKLELPNRNEFETPDDSATTAANQYLEALDSLLAVFPNSKEQVVALVTDVDNNSALVHTRDYGEVSLQLDDTKWARRHLTVNRLGSPPKAMQELLSAGDVIYIQPKGDTPHLAKQPAQPTAQAPTADQIDIDWQLSQIPNISGSIISIDPNDGRIISLVGGYDFFLNKYNRAVQSVRQPGSNIKPFIYSAGLDSGFTPSTLISGAPIVMTDPASGTLWRPENYSGKFFGPTRMREALYKSMNLVSIRLLRAIGIPYARDYLERFGLNMQRFSPTLTMALGSGGVTPLEMLGAYAALANGGYRIETYFIDHISNRDGDIVYQAKKPEFCDECYQQYLPKPELADDLDTIDSEQDKELVDEPVMPEQTEISQADEEIVEESSTYEAPRVMSSVNNFMIVSMLKDVIRRGTGRKVLALNRQDLAGKTGTTNDYVDAWFTGFNSKVATTVWVGFDEPTTMGRGEAGSVAALPIWIEYMRSALQDIEQVEENIPEYISEGLVNRNSGEVTDELDPQAVAEYFPIEALVPELERNANADPDPNMEAYYPAEGSDANNSTSNLDSDLDSRVLGDDETATPQNFEPNDEGFKGRLLENNEPRIIETEEDTDGLF